MLAEETFERLHSRVVARLASSSASLNNLDEDNEALEELLAFKETFSKPYGHTQREVSLSQQALAQHVATAHPQLKHEAMVRVADDISQKLNLHQHDVCALLEKAMQVSPTIVELPDIVTSMFYREQVYVSMCINDLAIAMQSSKVAVSFMATLAHHGFIKNCFNAIADFLRDLVGTKGSDTEYWQYAHGAIRVLMETIMVFFEHFHASPEEVDMMIHLVPQIMHDATSQPAGGLAVSYAATAADLDLAFREDKTALCAKLAMTIINVLNPQTPKWTVPAAGQVPPLDQLEMSTQVGGPLQQMQSRLGVGFWNEEHHLGRLVCFAVNGVFANPIDTKVLDSALVEWSMSHYILQEILLSPQVVGEAFSRNIIVKTVNDLLAQAWVLPKWTWMKKLENKYVRGQRLQPGVLQVGVLRMINRLIRMHPQAASSFKELVLYCTDSFHMPHAAFATMGLGGDENGGMDPWALDAPVLEGLQSTYLPGNDPQVAMGALELYIEILDLLATVLSRGTLDTAKHVTTKLSSHGNQWFSLPFLLEYLTRFLRSGPGGIYDQAPLSGKLKNSPNFRVNREMRGKNVVYNPFSDEF